MDKINDRIKKYIIKNTVGKIFFSQEKKSYQLVLRQIGQKEKNKIFEEIKKYPEWNNATSFSLNSLYDDVRNTIDLCYKTKNTSLQHLNIDELQIGNIVCLKGEDEEVGFEDLRLMYIGKGEGEYSRFLVLSSGRMAIQPEDILEVYDTTLWGMGHPVSFKVFRKGKRIPSENMVYRTLPINALSIVLPSIVHEVIDSRHDYSYEEYEADKIDQRTDYQFDYTLPSMGLLLREHTNGIGIFADFDNEGKMGSIYTEEKIPVNIGEASFLFSKLDDSTQTITRVVTEEKGLVRIDSDTHKIKLVKKIKAKIWKN